MKPKIGVYLTDDVARRLDLASGPGRTKSDIVNEAVDRFLDPAPAKGLGAELLGRLEAQTKTLRRIHRDVEIIAESFGLFVRYFLMITPPLPESEQAAAHKLGRERFAVFVKQIGRRIGSDSQLVSEVMQTVARAQAAACHKTSQSPAADAAAPEHPSKPTEDASHG